jgi:hypothetical protein
MTQSFLNLFEQRIPFCTATINMFIIIGADLIHPSFHTL